MAALALLAVVWWRYEACVQSALCMAATGLDQTALQSRAQQQALRVAEHLEQVSARSVAFGWRWPWNISSISSGERGV